MTATTLEGKKVVLVQCGSFNPPHYLHLRLMEMARDHLRERGAVVAHGLLSPVSDAYAKRGLLPASHRAEMCRLAAQGSGWVAVDAWEAAQPGYTPTRRVLDHVRARFAENGEGDTTPLLVCGADLLESFDAPGVWAPDDMDAILRMGVVCIEREGVDSARLIAGSAVLAPHAASIFLVPPTVSNNVSSTAIRACAAKGRSLRYLLPDLVIDYIRQHNLYKEGHDA